MAITKASFAGPPQANPAGMDHQALKVGKSGRGAKRITGPGAASVAQALKPAAGQRIARPGVALAGPANAGFRRR